MQGLLKPANNEEVAHALETVRRTFSDPAKQSVCRDDSYTLFRRLRSEEREQRLPEPVVLPDDRVWPEDDSIWTFHDAVARLQGYCLCKQRATVSYILIRPWRLGYHSYLTAFRLSLPLLSPAPKLSCPPVDLSAEHVSSTQLESLMYPFYLLPRDFEVHLVFCQRRKRENA
jgi:hypothetical protein